MTEAKIGYTIDTKSIDETTEKLDKLAMAAVMAHKYVRRLKEAAAGLDVDGATIPNIKVEVADTAPASKNQAARQVVQECGNCLYYSQNRDKHSREECLRYPINCWHNPNFTTNDRWCGEWTALPE